MAAARSGQPNSYTPFFSSANSDFFKVVSYDSARGIETTYVLKRFKVNRDDAFREISLHRFASSVTHLGVARFVQEWTEGGSLGFFMEACKLEDLDTMYKRMKESSMKWSEQEILKFAIAMMQVVSKLHSVGLVHLNIKPENWLLTHDSHLRLTDFGSAELIPANSSPLALGQTLYNQPMSKFLEDVRGLGRTLYQIALLKPYRFMEETGRDMIEQRTLQCCRQMQYTETLQSIIITLLLKERDLKEVLREAKRAVGM